MNEEPYRYATEVLELAEQLSNKFEYNKVLDIVSTDDFNANIAQELSQDFYREMSIRGKRDDAGEGLSIILEKYTEYKCDEYGMAEEQIKQIVPDLVPKEGLDTDKDADAELSNLRGLLEQ